jgi:hypothetical protein
MLAVFVPPAVALRDHFRHAWWVPMNNPDMVVSLDKREIERMVVGRVAVDVVHIETIRQALAQPFLCAIGVRLEPSFLESGRDAIMRGRAGAGKALGVSTGNRRGLHGLP